MRVPFIRINQYNEMFFITKFKVSDLKKMVTFHFRSNDENYSKENVQEYIQKLQNKGIKLKSSDEGIQRRLELKRITDIKSYLEDNKDIIFPTTVILSCTIQIDSLFYSDNLKSNTEMGYLDFDPQVHTFRIIDGQHRLAGMFISDENLVDELELSVTILFNITLPTEAKLFSDINGKQKSVSKSLVYDLYEEMGKDEIDHIYKYHNICTYLNTEMTSPLYKQIKMLGVGKGAVSQSFVIDYLTLALKKHTLKSKTSQYIFEQLFLYFKSFQEIFPNDWPVPLDINNLDSHSEYVLKKRKSQLVKTNGFGAILTLFPIIYDLSNQNYLGYIDIVKKLEGKIDWTKSEGTGKQPQANFIKIIKKGLGLIEK